MPRPSVSGQPPVADPATTPLARTVLAWTLERLRARGYAVPTCKRLAFLVTGLLVAPSASRGALATALEDLAITPAKSESIARRLARLLDEPDLDPARLLPDLFADLLPQLLQGLVAAHRANQGAAAHHRRFRPLRLIVDATSKADQVHLLAAGLAYQGIVLPLALRTWEQNAPLEEGAYWLHLSGLLLDVQALLPPELRDHLVLLADRGFGVPRFLDLLATLGWAWVVRVPGGVALRRADGTQIAARALAPRPGAVWCSGFGHALTPVPVAAFKDAGWRPSQFVAVWPPEAAEPWLLLTNLAATKERFADYAARWAIERLFLAWKSHGWDLESLRVRAPARVGRLAAALAVATLWTLVAALPRTLALAADLAERARARPAVVEQLRLPLDPPAPSRPWPAHFSLLTWGRKVLAHLPARFQSPPLRWDFPDWDAPPWSIRCAELYHAIA